MKRNFVFIILWNHEKSDNYRGKPLSVGISFGGFKRLDIVDMVCGLKALIETGSVIAFIHI